MATFQKSKHSFWNKVMTFLFENVKILGLKLNCFLFKAFISIDKSQLIQYLLNLG